MVTTSSLWSKIYFVVNNEAVIFDPIIINIHY